jgi:hypothetical protein
MIINCSKVKRTNNNITIKTLPLSLISNVSEVVNNQNISLESTLHNDFEYSDEEWLKAKHRILDDRMEFRKKMRTVNNANLHCPNN